ncbi:UDP-N-acetylmuramate dehydrogenase [Sporosarcina sp. GW1-11]|uniref:UDP-N-acetylmuramate dehydrogenase n=1 Tax=Sporosarcina sp. GW1-11 TaxID=2899126 RepID=UPI00294EC167|nr:UDP-N-acetylmuramate dehydrogenase [Sporosarcina sp. GW1-11]MDV6378477.1 UDP-N-acetylmuramate dehydrogenase [Sporosarcina sp. GW1-11]
MSKHRWFEDLNTKIQNGWLLLDEPLNKYTKTRLGGKADIVAAPGTMEEVQAVVTYAYEQNVPILLLGNGSNMVVRDGGVRGIVIYMANFNHIEITGDKMVAEAGAHIIDASRAAAKACLSGLEFACGIPGSIGGAMAMNAGAYGGEIKDIITRATVMDNTGKIFVLSKDELELGYRKSIITEKGYYVLSAEFRLTPGVQRDIDLTVADLTFQRESKQPLEYPSAGSVFKRPPGNFAGKLIQDSGLQGKGFGGAEVSTKHAGFIVNKKDATATDYIRTIQMVKDEVKKKFGIELEMEVKIVGEELSE